MSWCLAQGQAWLEASWQEIASIFNAFLFCLLSKHFPSILFLLWSTPLFKWSCTPFLETRLDWFLHENVPDFPGPFLEKPMEKAGYSCQKTLISPQRFGKPMNRQSGLWKMFFCFFKFILLSLSLSLLLSYFITLFLYLSFYHLTCTQNIDYIDNYISTVLARVQILTTPQDAYIQIVLQEG